MIGPLNTSAPMSPFREDGAQFAWDGTSLKWAMTCLRLYKYKMIDRWDARNRSEHLTFGLHYAKALEVFYGMIADGMLRDEALANVLLMTLSNTWEYARDEHGDLKFSASGNRIGAPWMSTHPSKNRENLIRSIIWYVDEFREDHVNTVTLDGKAAVEYSFRLEIDYGNFFSGHIDRLCEFANDYYIMDQKTTGHTISPSFFNQFDLDSQPSGYIFAGSAIYEVPVKGVIIDGAQIAVGFTRFERGYTYRTEDQLDEWYDDALYHIERAQQAVLHDHFPKNTTACNNYGGCEFRNVCSRPKALRSQFLHGDFKLRPQWNPLEER